MFMNPSDRCVSDECQMRVDELLTLIPTEQLDLIGGGSVMNNPLYRGG